MTLANGHQLRTDTQAAAHEAEWQAIESDTIGYVSSETGRYYLVPREDYNKGPRQQSHRPHPDSYRPDLPLRGDAGLYTATRQDKAAWDARPLDLFDTNAWSTWGNEEQADQFNADLKSGKLRHYNIRDRRSNA